MCKKVPILQLLAVFDWKLILRAHISKASLTLIRVGFAVGEGVKLPLLSKTR